MKISLDRKLRPHLSHSAADGAPTIARAEASSSPTSRPTNGVTGPRLQLVFGGGGAEARPCVFEKRLAEPGLIGEDPLFIERLWERFFAPTWRMKSRASSAYALSALDIGLWDIAGKGRGDWPALQAV